MSDLEDDFQRQLEIATPDKFEREFRGIPGRKFQFDFAFPRYKVAVEIEGGTWSGGRHTRGSGFKADCEKYNLATIHGWRVLRFTRDSVVDGSGALIVRDLIVALKVAA